MKSPYTHIAIKAIPQDLEEVIKEHSEVNIAINEETRLALSAPDLKQALKEIMNMTEVVPHGPGSEGSNRNTLLLAHIYAKNALKALEN